MSQQSGGPGYWQASDGLWYPPESHPDRGQSQPTVPVAAAGYPVRMAADENNKVANWRALVHWLMVIPHLIISSVLSWVAQIVGFVSWLIVLFTGKMPEGIHGFQAMYLRYQNRAYGFMLLLTEEYPPFEFETTAADTSGYTIRSDFDYQPGPRNRLTTFLRVVMVIPQVLVLLFVYLAAYAAYIIGWFAVLFTGTMPQGIRGFLIGVGRWNTRVLAYFWLLTDEYPPFSTD